MALADLNVRAPLDVFLCTCECVPHFAPTQAWHREKPNAILVNNYDRFIGPNGAKTRVLVPLCGKTVDMPYLAQRGKHDMDLTDEPPR